MSVLKSNRQNKAVAIWLIIITIMVLAMIMVGGATRLTNSGLSIVHWSPIHGIIPPLNDAQWLEEFSRYQQIPQYKYQNFGMSLGDFKFIFWWEFSHRLLGRALGLAYLIPLLLFWRAGYITIIRDASLFFIVLYIGFQGFIGWWMVSSGLSGDRLSVAAYRLAAHLGLAFGLLLILCKKIYYFLNNRRLEPSYNDIWFGLLIMAFIQVILGAFVAGTHSGFVNTDWPTFGGKLYPSDYFALKPILRNFVENTATIQFNHRIFGYLLAISFGYIYLSKLSRLSAGGVAIGAFVIITIFAQITLGIYTLKVFESFTPPLHQGVLMGVAHQTFAAICFMAIVFAWCICAKNVKN